MKQRLHDAMTKAKSRRDAETLRKSNAKQNSLSLCVSAPLRETRPAHPPPIAAPNAAVKQEVHHAVTKAKSRLASADGCCRLHLSGYVLPDTEAVPSAFFANPIKPQRTSFCVEPKKAAPSPGRLRYHRAHSTDTITPANALLKHPGIHPNRLA